MKEAESAENVVSLDRERGAKFIRKLAEKPFIALTVTTDGEVEIFTKGIEPDHLDQIKAVLSDIVGEEE